jgi:hypothetical protein
MAFNNHEASDERTEPFNIEANTNDRRIIDEFENELAPYESRSVTVLQGYKSFERTLSGFSLFLHENGILCYSRAYPLGAFVQDKLKEYRFLKLKMEALTRLRESRNKAAEHQRVQTDSLVAQMAPAA